MPLPRIELSNHVIINAEEEMAILEGCGLQEDCLPYLVEGAQNGVNYDDLLTLADGLNDLIKDLRKAKNTAERKALFDDYDNFYLVDAAKLL